MKKPFRLPLIAVAAAAGLALAATALPASSSRPLAVQKLTSGRSFQAYTPSVTVQQSSYKVGAHTNVGFLFYTPLDQDSTQDATAKLTIFAPAGYTNVLTQAPSTVIGKAYAVVFSGQLQANLTLTGDVVVGDPTSPALMAAYSLQLRIYGLAAHRGLLPGGREPELILFDLRRGERHRIEPDDALVEDRVRKASSRIAAGDFSLGPEHEQRPCKLCAYRPICTDARKVL